MFQRIDYKRRKFSLGFGWMIASIVFCLGGQKIKAVEPSGTLPVITIHNENNVPINDKINYIKGTYKVDPKTTIQSRHPKVRCKLGAVVTTHGTGLKRNPIESNLIKKDSPIRFQQK